MRPRCSSCEVANKASMAFAAGLLGWLVVSPQTFIIGALWLVMFMGGVVLCRMECCD